MKNTTNYGLKKPDSTDMYNVAHFNENMDTIDAELKKHSSHTTNKSNPHSVTKAQVGLSNVDNTADVNKPVSNATQTELNKKANVADLTSHTSNKNNPHSVTKAQVGLGNVDNTSDKDKPVSTAVQKEIDAIKQSIIDVDAINEASGSPILMTDTADGTVSDFRGYGRSTQNGTPTPDSPIAIKSVADGGWFDGELLQGYYNTDGSVNGVAQHVSAKNLMPCNVGDVIKFTYAETVTKLVILFFDDTKYLSQVGADNSAIVNATAPSGATRFGITIQSTKGITPQTAKKIVVTINDTYALIEKSIWKNLLNINESDKAVTYFTYTEYTNESVKGSAIPTTNGTFLCSYSAYLEKGKTYFFSQESTSLNSVYIYSDRLWGNNIGNVNVVTAPYYAHKADSGIYVIGYYGAITSGTEYSIVKPMLRRAEVTDDTYEPYKETVSYITLNEPLRSSLDGSVRDVVDLGERKVTRKYAKVVYNATSFMEANSYDNVKYFSLPKPANSKAYGKNADYPVISDKFTFYAAGSLSHDNAKAVGAVNAMAHSLRYWFGFPVGTTLEEAQSIGDITLIYELAEPIVETIEPVDIVTYDNVTYLTASDNAEMWVEYYSNSSVGQRLAKTDEEMKAEHKYLQEQITIHTSREDNPHNVTKEQVGLGNVDNTSDVNKPISTATQNALNDITNSFVPTTTGTDAIFCKSGNVVVLHLNGVTTRIDNKSRCLLDISTDVFAQFPPVYVSATKPTQYLVVFRDSETNAVSTAIAKIIQDNGRYYVQIFPIMNGTLADNADGTVNGTIMYLTN